MRPKIRWDPLHLVIRGIILILKNHNVKFNKSYCVLFEGCRFSGIHTFLDILATMSTGFGYRWPVTRYETLTIVSSRPFLSLEILAI